MAIQKSGGTLVMFIIMFRLYHIPAVQFSAAVAVAVVTVAVPSRTAE